MAGLNRDDRVLLYNDLFALMGGVLGPMAPFIVKSYQVRDYLAAGLIFLGSSVAIGLGLWLRRPLVRRRWAFFSVCTYMGIFSGALVAFKWDAWARAGVLRYPEYWGNGMGLVMLLSFWGMGLMMLLILPRATPGAVPSRVKN